MPEGHPGSNLEITKEKEDQTGITEDDSIKDRISRGNNRRILVTVILVRDMGIKDVVSTTKVAISRDKVMEVKAVAMAAKKELMETT